MIARSGSKRWVSGADAAARKSGVRVGMPAAKAQAIFHGLMLVDADPVADAAALERITLWALGQYSPLVAVDAPDGIIMNRVFESVDDAWRRSNVPTEALVQLAEADAFLPSLELERRDALWAIKALRDEPLPLFAAAAEREAAVIAEQQEPEVHLRQMTDGHNVIQDYGHDHKLHCPVGKGS